jgi:hypothetical protein
VCIARAQERRRRDTPTVQSLQAVGWTLRVKPHSEPPQGGDRKPAAFMMPSVEEAVGENWWEGGPTSLLQRSTICPANGDVSGPSRTEIADIRWRNTRSAEEVRKRVTEPLQECLRVQPPDRIACKCVSLVERYVYGASSRAGACGWYCLTDHAQRLFASGSCQPNDVLHVQDLLRIALAGNGDHSAPHFLQGTKARWV